jgi:hypothetical protein
MNKLSTIFYYMLFLLNHGVNEYGGVGGMRISKGTKILGRNLRQCHFVHHISHMIQPGIEHRL